MDFKEAVKIVLELEGGETIVNDPDDPGGTTKYGISARAHPELGPKGVEALTESEAMKIYFQDYWEPVKAGDLPAALRLAVFDSAVNQGVKKASELIQTAANTLGETLRIDGVIGVETLSVLSGLAADRLADEFMRRRMSHYRTLPTFEKYGRGWENRLIKISLSTRF